MLNLQAERDLQHKDLEALSRLSNELGSVEKQMEVGVRWSSFFWILSDYPSAAEAAERVVTHAEADGNPHFAARGQLHWGRALVRQDQYELASKHLKQALDGFRTIGDQRMEGFTLRTFGLVALNQWDFKAWQDFLLQALSIAQEMGDRSDEAEAINALGHIEIYIGEFTTAERYFRQYLALSREIGNRYQERMALTNLGWVTNYLKDYPAALKYSEQSLVLARSIGAYVGEGYALNTMGDTLTDMEMWDKATHAYSGALELFEEIDYERGIMETRIGIARLALIQGDVEWAFGYIDEILSYLEQDQGFGNRSPIECYLVSIQVLLSVADPRAFPFLETTYVQLQEMANKITDRAKRQSFLENVPYNRELVRLWEEKRY